MDPAVTVTDLVVDRGHRRVLNGLCSPSKPRGSPGCSGRAAAGDHADARARRRPARPQRRGHRARRPAGSPGCAHRVGYVTQAPSVYEDLTVRENVRYFAALYGLRRAGGRRRDRRRRPGRRGGAARPRPVRGPAGPGLARLRPRQRARRAGARRADGRPRPGAARRALGPVPRPRRRRDDADRLQPRDGRGRPLRPAAAPPRRHLLADSTPAQLRADGGSDDLEEAFLQLIRARAQEVAA